MDQLKVAIMGAGKRAQEYMRVLKTMSDQFKLVAVCSDNQTLPDELADFSGISTYSNGDALFENHEIDFSVVASDPMKVHDDAVKVLEHDVHLLADTPIGVDLHSIDRLGRLAQLHRVMVEVSEPYFRRPHERIKQELVQSGLIGDVNFAYARFIGHGYHAVNVLRSYVGFDVPPIRVWGFQRDYGVEPHSLPSGAEIQSEQWQHGIIEFRGGTRAIYDFTSAAYQSPIRWRRAKANTEIYGKKGMCVGLDIAVGNGSGDTQEVSVKRRTIKVDEIDVVDAYVVDSTPEIVWENPYRSYPLTDGQISLAAALTSIQKAIQTGSAPEYGLFNARTDREVDIAMANSSDRQGDSIEIL